MASPSLPLHAERPRSQFLRADSHTFRLAGRSAPPRLQVEDKLTKARRLKAEKKLLKMKNHKLAEALTDMVM